MLRNRNNKSNSAHRGFTLIELLVVTLILSILMAVALPLYLSSIADSKRKTCRANMQTIANAVQASRVRLTLPDYGKFNDTVPNLITNTLLPDLQQTPVCPNGGTYSVTTDGTKTPGGFLVKCTIAGDGTFEPGVDSN